MLFSLNQGGLSWSRGSYADTQLVGQSHDEIWRELFGFWSWRGQDSWQNRNHVSYSSSILDDIFSGNWLTCGSYWVGDVRTLLIHQWRLTVVVVGSILDQQWCLTRVSRVFGSLVLHWFFPGFFSFPPSNWNNEPLALETINNNLLKYITFTCYFSVHPDWFLSLQMNSTFLLQGLHMNLNMNNRNMTKKSCSDSDGDRAVIPAASLSLADVVVVLLVIPLMDKIVYPWLDRRGWGMTLSKRILVGKITFVMSQDIYISLMGYHNNRDLNHPQESRMPMLEW